MSAWRDRMRAASYNGVPFLVETAELSGGRRNAVHEYPFRDGDPYVEDVGAKGRDFTIEGFVIGDDYLSQRDDLLGELERGGPGELVHPHYGTRRVAVDTFTIREAPITEGGMARFRISFLATTGEPVQPTAVADSAAAVKKGAASAKASAAGVLQAAFSTATTVYDGVTGALKGATSAIDGVIGKVSLATQTASSLQRQVSQFANDVVGLASVPGDIVTTAQGMFDALRDAILSVPNMTDPLGVFLGLYGFDAGTQITSTTTAGRAADTSNAAAVQAYLQRLAVIAAAEVAPALTYASYEDAVTARERIAALLDAIAEGIPDETFPDLMQLRADLVNAVPGDASDLPHLLAYTPRGTVPSLVLSHRLYGDVQGEADILARNKVRHPGFVIGGVDLEVLSRE